MSECVSISSFYYAMGPVIVLLISVLLCLIRVQYKMNKMHNVPTPNCTLPNEQSKRLKMNSFHLPKLYFNKTDKTKVSCDDEVKISCDGEVKAHSERNIDLNDTTMEKRNIANRIRKDLENQAVILAPSKMEEICKGVLNNKYRRLNFSDIEHLENRNVVVRDRKSRKSFFFNKAKSTSVPELEHYDIVSRVRPVEMSISSEEPQTDDTKVHLFADSRM